MVSEMVGNAHPTIAEPALRLDKAFSPGSSIEYPAFCVQIIFL